MGFCLFLSCFRFFLSFSFSFLFFFFLCLCSCFAFFSVSVRPFLLYFTYYRPAIHHIHFSKVFLISNNNNNDDDDDDNNNNNNNNNNLCRISPFPFFFRFSFFGFHLFVFFLSIFLKKTLTLSFEHPKIFVITKKVFSIGIFYIRYILSPPESNQQPTTHTLFLFFFSLLSHTTKTPTHTHSRTLALSPTHNTLNTYTKLFLYYIFFL